MTMTLERRIIKAIDKHFRKHPTEWRKRRLQTYQVLNMVMARSWQQPRDERSKK
jgi:hypothetical protein